MKKCISLFIFSMLFSIAFAQLSPEGIIGKSKGYPDYLEDPKVYSLGSSANFIPLNRTSFFAIKTGDINLDADPQYRRSPAPDRFLS